MEDSDHNTIKKGTRVINCGGQQILSKVDDASRQDKLEKMTNKINLLEHYLNELRKDIIITIVLFNV